MGSLYNWDSNQLLGCGELLPLEMAQHIRHLCGPDRYATGAVRDLCRSGAPAVGREGHTEALQMVTDTSVVAVSKWDPSSASLWCP